MKDNPIKPPSLGEGSGVGFLYYPKNLCDAPAYIFGGVSENSDLVFWPDFTRQPRSFVHKVLKFLFVGRLPLGGRMVEWLTGYEGYSRLSSLKEGDRLLLNGVTNLHTLQAVAWLTPKGVRRFNYFNNCLRFVFPEATVPRLVASMKRMGYELMTFDPDEARQHGMTYTEQFYRFPAEPCPEPVYDFFFCGERKDRGPRLEALQKALEAQGYKCLFVVVDKGGAYITYEQYLDYLRQSRCVVDVVQAGQVGITRRPIEALFFNKKLLTENASISSCDFFRPENTLVMQGDYQHRIQDFMSAPLVPVSDAIKRRYDVNQWLRYFR